MLTNTRQGHPDENNPIKHYLMEYRSLVQRRDALMEELDRLRDATVRATARISAVGPSGVPNHGAREEAILRVFDGEERLREVIAHIGEALTVRLVLIERLTDERSKTLLTLRYINGWGWERIGYEMHYERSQVFELHHQALAEAQCAMEAAQRSE